MENVAVVSSSINKAKSKREKLLKNVQYYKTVVTTWEAAVSKAEGRKPGKTDLKTAPESVQKAYREYYKLKKYLKGNSNSKGGLSSEKVATSSKGPSPSKIFFGRTTGRGNSRSPKKSPTASTLKCTKRSGILKDSCSSSSKAMQTKRSAGVSFNVFKEKMSFVASMFQNKSPPKKHKEVEVVSTPEACASSSRKILIPSRLSRSTVLRSSSMSLDSLNPSDMDKDHTKVSAEPLSAFFDEPDHVAFNSSNLAIENNYSKSGHTSGMHNSVSAIWHSFSPKSKSSNTKHVDSQWLQRCRTIAHQGEEIDPEQNLRNERSMSDGFDTDQDEEESINPETSNVSSKQLFAESFKNFLMSAESSEEQHTDSGFINDNNNSNTIVVPDREMFDSGLGMSSSFVFSAQEIMDVITNEVLPETTRPTDKDNIHNENACSPPEQNFQTIDVSVMSNLISTNPFASAISPCNLAPANTPEEDTFRKRKAIFSPSPKKPSPKKKFFKSSRIKAKYGVGSYKPPTPLKKKNVNSGTTISRNKKQLPSVTEYSMLHTVGDAGSDATQSQSLTTPTRLSKKSKTNDDVPISFRDCEPQASTSQDVASNHLTKVEYFDEAAQDGSVRQPRNKRRKLANGMEGIGSRMKKGKMNENFVKIDITKKVFVRGHKKISGAKTKRNDWKMKKAAASKEDKLKSLVCRKCGEVGHFRKFCMKDIIQSEEPQQIDDSPFPSLEEAASMAKSNGGIPTNRVNIYELKAVSQEQTEEDTHQSEGVRVEEDKVVQNCSIKPIEPYFMSCHGSGTVISQESEDEILDAAIHKFGYKDFRPGQREAVSRILKGLSTLCILSTGSGKSLCYQLPAYIYAEKNPGALAICVSPLVSLMEDQVQGIPSFLNAAFLHSNMPSSQKEKVIEKIRSKKLHILLVSPEAVCGGLFGILRGNDLPQISFACIDEVHCVSQWSHNFRPCYLQLSKILREKLRVRTILGLTATATEYTANSICQTLQVDPSTTIRGEIIPENLNLSASRDTYRDEALLALLQGDRFSSCESIIIYCTRRDECQRIAALIRTKLQNQSSKHSGVSKINCRQRVSNTCEAYHAGMTAGKRRLVQHQFMSGNIRIVVATVAFGMGIDKADIRAVIHYNMPKTFESYVQEIGRAGRDGEPAHCHLFLDNVKGRDLSELKRHVYCNSIDRATLRKLLRKVFPQCKCDRIANLSRNGPVSRKNSQKERCPGHEASFSIEETVHLLDLPQENITTILCYLELDSTRKWIEMLPHTYQTCKMHSYGGAALLKSSALKCPPLAAAIALMKEKKKFKDSDVYLEFDVIEVASTLGWNSGAVKKELKGLEWTSTNFDGTGNGKFRKSGILVEFCNLAFHVNAPGDLTDEESDAVLDYLHNHNQEQEKTQLYQLHRVYQALLSISSNTVESISEKSDEEKSNSLKKFIHSYFLQKTLGVPPEWKNEVTYPEHQEEEIRRNVGDLLASVKDAQFTGRSVARIFQGIPSPCFPVEDWARNRSFWRKHIECDFHYLCKIASEEILRF